MFMLFSKAYPCIIDVDADTCLTPHLVLVLGVLLPSLSVVDRRWEVRVLTQILPG